MQRRFQRMFLLIPALALLGLSMVCVSGCNTVEGLGDDISGASRAVSGDGSSSARTTSSTTAK